MHSSNEPYRNKIQRDENRRISVVKRNRSAPDPLCVKWFSAVIIGYLFLAEIMEEFSLHSHQGAIIRDEVSCPQALAAWGPQRLNLDRQPEVLGQLRGGTGLGVGLGFDW